MSRKGTLYIGLGLLLWLFTLQSVSAVSFWNVNVGDEFKWTFRDNYYLINGYESVAETQNRSFLSANSLYIADYEVMKDWSRGYLQCIVATNNQTINRIKIAINYDGLAGNVEYIRSYAIDPEFALETFVPWKIDPSEENATISDYTISGDGYFNAQVGNVFTEDDWDLVQFMRFQFMGDVAIYWMDDNIEVFNYTYSFHYVNPYVSEENREPYQSYESIGMKLNVVKKGDFDQDYDIIEDLVIMNTNYVRINEYYVETPNYLEASSVFTIINSILRAIRDSEAEDPPPEFLNFGFSLPSGMYTMYSDTASTLQALIMNSDVLTRNILVPIIIGANPTEDGLIEVFDDLGENDVYPIRIFNVLGILSFSNLLILPSGTDFSKMNDIVFEISEIFADLAPSEYVENLALDDAANIQYALSNILASSNAKNVFSIGVNPLVLPTIYDSRNGQTQIEIKLNWDTKQFLLRDFMIEINHPQNGYGHQISLSFVDPQAESGWMQQILGGITILFSILGLGVVVRKTAIKRRRHFTINSDLQL